MTERSLREMRLTAVTPVADDTTLFAFRALDGQELPGIEPGAHIDLHLPTGIVRQYSLVIDEEDRRQYVVAVKKDRKSRGGSRLIHEEIGVGTVLRVGGPRNLFALVLQEFGKIPGVGDKIEVGEWRFEIVDLDGRRIDKVLANRIEAS